MCEFKFRWTIRKVPAIWGNSSPAKVGNTGIKTRSCEELLNEAQFNGLNSTDAIIARWNGQSDVWFYEPISPKLDFTGGVCRACFRQRLQALTAFFKSETPNRRLFRKPSESNARRNGVNL